MFPELVCTQKDEDSANHLHHHLQSFKVTTGLELSLQNVRLNEIRCVRLCVSLHS